MATPCVPCVRQWTLLLALATLLAAAAASRPAQQLHTISAASPPGGALETPTITSPVQRSLITSYFDVETPVLQLLPAAQSSLRPRPGRTALRLTLPGARAVSPFMPVVCPRATGMTHEVVKTWSALMNYVRMFARANAINAGAGNNEERLFPQHCIAAAAAADSLTATMDVGAVIDAAEARGDRSAWTEAYPASVLLRPFGQSMAAVAEIMGTTYDEAADAITLDLELVHNPRTVTEFTEHGKQTLEPDTAHFHFVTPSGIKVDAGGLLQALQQSHYKVPGIHVFLKATFRPTGPSKLRLAPAKSYRHIHQRAAVAAWALGDNGAGVPDIPILFAVAGDCDPSLASSTTTTDASGRAIAYISAQEPGAVAVVAAATSDSGVRLVTPAAHVIFFDDHEYVEHKEGQYYGGSHDSHSGATEAYGEATEPADADSDAARFAAEATQKALAQLPA